MLIPCGCMVKSSTSRCGEITKFTQGLACSHSLYALHHAGAYTTARTFEQNKVFELTAHINRLASSCQQMLQHESQVPQARPVVACGRQTDAHSRAFSHCLPFSVLTTAVFNVKMLCKANLLWLDYIVLALNIILRCEGRGQATSCSGRAAFRCTPAEAKSHGFLTSSCSGVPASIIAA